jgi:hypothetical protein
MSREIINPNIKRVILHIGLHKTGTTSIQSSFWESADILINHGVLYPTSCIPKSNSRSAQAHHNHFLHLLFKEDLTYYMRNLYLTPQQIDEERAINQAKLIQEFQNTTAHTIVISSENVSVFNRNELQHIYDFFMDNFDAVIDIYIYMRQPIEWTRSMLQQLIWQNHTYQSAWDHLKKRLFVNYTTVYDRCVDVFGTSHTHVCTYESLLHHQDGFFAGFCSDVGINISGITLPQYNMHSSATLFTINICDYINTHEPFHKNNILNPQRILGDKKSLRLISGPRFEMPAHLVIEANTIFAAYTHTLYEQFGIDYTTTKSTQALHDTSTHTLEPDFYSSLSQAYKHSNPIIRALMVRYMHHAIQHEKRLNDIDRQQFMQLIPQLEAIPNP